MGRRSGVTAEQTRTQLLDATLEVLQAKGYEGTRVAAIAREAEVTPGAIYHHYGSKTELLAAAIGAHAPEAVAELLATRDGSSVLDALRRAGSALPDHAHGTGRLVVELIATAARDPEVGGPFTRSLAEKEAILVDVLRAGQGAGGLDPDLDPAALARFATLLALGSQAAAALDLDPVDDAAWDTVVERSLAGIRPADPPTDTTRPLPDEGNRP